MNLLLFTDQEQVIEAWEKEFHGYDGVTVYQGALEDIPEADCLVTAGNSFGIMDGGLDAAVKLQFPDAATNVTEAIAANYLGEIPVGQAIIVPTNDEIFRYLGYVPTMRFPRNIPAEAVYDATRAILLEARKFNENELSEEEIADELGEQRETGLIESIALPSFGTRTGGVGAFKAAHMMRMAYDSIYERAPEVYGSWDAVEEHLKRLYQRS